ncbi:MAG: PSD1 and planctomycete cytochrome C domain-containing protein [Gemmataceae bacterium]|nr:PSD1 and planctomycete cytochrome C domain-containing protein [Gemmataceae bacterium]MCS7269637.1 PSD1 and planctomycete cytochrome C domain-containing protein [Gemmataceae bacterium]MDW8242744.1 PSD1 and planctomycete cytochrome C domain-containing protein [Thermogemmata sp.]
MMQRYLQVVIVGLMVWVDGWVQGVAAAEVDYLRDVRPILSNACFKCHGPGTQKGKLRLDEREAAVRRGAIVPGQPAESELLRRITASDEAERMPPPESGDRLSPQQVDTLRRWIAAGAPYAPHWAFSPPRRPAVPQTRFATVNPIDNFIRYRLEQEGLTPSPPADKATLLRRVYLDLTGLLPTPAEVDAFLRDESPDAYEKVVDRLLASPHYGERQARHWLDLARYADSNGYTIDGPRSIWPYRDWVIAAFNADMPFDQFTREQLAGDLLPQATQAQKIATGFHRNTPFNEEGGTDPEQFRVERTVDRTNTTGTVWLGLTIACAQCHDHKYDPITQVDYYRLYAFFNSCDEPTLVVGGDPRLERTIAHLQAMNADLQRVGDVEGMKIVQAQIKKVQGKLPTTLVMRERPTPRSTHVLIRGDFLRPGSRVTPGFPAILGPTPADRPLNRLDLAHWLTAPDNPLTARVTVNREWQKFFGRGLVETENDFGYQGSLPTHPELLDWLAVEFRDNGWSFKKLHKLIVLSATYRQASTQRTDLAVRDPRNLLLARQNRLRLEAEIIRDAALCASGMLNPQIGGPGVYPPQPREVFAFTQSNHPWPESKGPDRYRRGMYTFIWRQSQHHLLTTFDAPDAQTTCTRRNRSNTPLQALHLANDPVFVELAQHLGQRILREGPADDTGRLRYAFRLCLVREPTPAELQRLQTYLQRCQQEDPKTAWSAVARVLLNLDEFITRE